ncbi:MAG: YibE/F family protein [Desulfohalobiaceae bacterium]
MISKKQHIVRRLGLPLALLLLCIGLFWLPTGFEAEVDENSVRSRAQVLEVDNSQVYKQGMVTSGEQGLQVEIQDGPFAGEQLRTSNNLLGQMDRETLFQEGDTVRVVLSLNHEGQIVHTSVQDHARLGSELLLLGLFALLLLVFGGWTGAKALLSFLLAALMLWKILIPALLQGWDPVWITLGVVALLCASIIFLVGGVNRKALTAFLGAFLGVLTSCVLAVLFTDILQLRGAVMPFAETLLYAGYEHLDLTKIYVAAVFLACSGAVMDLSMDVAASMQEVVEQNPDISGLQLMSSGLNVGRAVVGTMTTTLLLAYSGGFITLLMAFMAKGVPLDSTFNFIYVAAEVLKTIVGSFGLVTVAPFTALVGGLLMRQGAWRSQAVELSN